MTDTVMLVLGLLIAVVIVLILRAVALWYWKINRIVARLDEISASLDGQTELLRKISNK